MIEKIQELLDKDEIKYKALSANVMTMSHASMSIKPQKGRKKLDEEKKNEEIKVQMVKVEDK